MDESIQTIQIGLEGQQILLNNLNISSYLSNNFEVKEVYGRGQSLFSKTHFLKDEFVIEYTGECLPYTPEEFNRRQEKYEARNEECFVLRFLTSDGSEYFFDATEESPGYAKYINHVRNPNLKPYHPVKLAGEDRYRIAFYASQEIHKGDELFWDYFYGRDPKYVLPLQPGHQIPVSLHWVYSELKEDKSVSVVLPLSDMTDDTSGLLHADDVIEKENTEPSSKLIEHADETDDAKENTNMEVDPYKFPDSDVELDCNDNKVLTLSLHRKKRESARGRSFNICTVCYKVCMKLSSHLVQVHGIKV